MKPTILLLVILACLLTALAREASAQEAGARKRLPSLSAEDVAASKDPITVAPAGAITTFYCASDKEDPIGRGTTLSFKEDQMSLSVAPDPRYKGGPINQIKLVVSGPGGRLIELWLSTEKMNSNLLPGSYEGAGRVEFAKYMQPGIS